MPGKATGAYTAALTELVSIYPTLAELTNTPLHDTLDGQSFASLFESPGADGPIEYAFSQYDHCHNAAMAPYDNNNCTHDAIHYMGYSVRSIDWRYTEWHSFNVTRNCVDWTASPFAVELYDHRGDDGTDFNAFGNENVAGDSQYSNIIAQLHAVAAKQFPCQS